MSYNSNPMGSGSRTTRRTFEFGRTHVVRPKGKHRATIVWLHGLGDKGSSWSQILETRPLPNIKCICPTAPTRPVVIFGGYPCTAFKLGIGGFGMGAAIALYSATCGILRQYGNGNRTLKSQMEGSLEAARRAISLPILLCHGDDVVVYTHGERSAQMLNSVGFRNLTFRCYNGVGHHTVPEEWMKSASQAGTRGFTCMMTKMLIKATRGYK